MMISAFKMMNFALKMMNLALKTHILYMMMILGALSLGYQGSVCFLYKK